MDEDGIRTAAEGDFGGFDTGSYERMRKEAMWNRAINTTPADGEDAAFWAANHISKALTNIDSYDGSIFNAGKPMSGAEYLGKMQELYRSRDLHTLYTPRFKELEELDNRNATLDEYYRTASKHTSTAEALGMWTAKALTPGRVTSQELDALTDEERDEVVKAGLDKASEKPMYWYGMRRDEMEREIGRSSFAPDFWRYYIGEDGTLYKDKAGEEKPGFEYFGRDELKRKYDQLDASIKDGSLAQRLKDREGKVSSFKELAKKRKTVELYRAKVAEENAWAMAMSTLAALPEDSAGRAILENALRFPDKTKEAAGEDFAKLISANREEAKLVAPALYQLQHANTDNAFVDGFKAFFRMSVDIPEGAFEQLANTVERAFVDGEEYQKRREEEAMMRRAFEGKVAEHGFFGDMFVGALSTLPYMAYAAIPYAGVGVVSAQAANELEQMAVNAGVDVSTLDFQLSKWAAGFAYAQIEKVQVLRPGLKAKLGAKGLARAYANAFTNARSALKVALNQTGRLASEVAEEGLQDATLQGTLAAFTGDDVAYAATEAFASSAYRSIGPFIPLMVMEAGGRHLNYRRGGLTADETAMAMHRIRALAEKQLGRPDGAVTKEEARKFGEEFGTMAVTWANAGADAKQRTAALQKTFGLSGADALMASRMLEDMYSAVSADEEAKRDFFAGARVLTGAEAVAKALRNAKIAHNEDGTSTVTGELGAAKDAQGRPVKVALSVREESLALDVNDKSTAISIVDALNGLDEFRDSPLTVEKWFEMSEDERRTLADKHRLKGQGSFVLSGITTFTDENGTEQVDEAGVDKQTLAVLSGQITLDEATLPQTAWHEMMHGFLRLVEKTSPELYAALQEAYPALDGAQENLNEELLSNRFRDHLTGKIAVAEFEKDLLDKIIDKAAELLGVVQQGELLLKPDTAQNALFNQMLSGDFSGIPEIDSLADVAKARRIKDAQERTRSQNAENEAEERRQSGQVAEGGLVDFGGEIVERGDELVDENGNAIPREELAEAFKSGRVVMRRAEHERRKRELEGKAEEGLKTDSFEGTDSTGKATVSTPNGEMQVETQLVVVDDTELVTSDMPGYDQTLQNRLGRENSAQIEKIANNPNPLLLGPSQTTDRGAPIVMPGTMNVVAGNGRILALRRGDEKNTTEAYDAYVRAIANRFGLEIADNIKHPRLVRIVTGNLSKEQYQKLAILSNQTDMKAETTAGNMKSDGMLLEAKNSDGMNIASLIATDPDAALTSDKNEYFVYAFIRALNDTSLLTSNESAVSVDGWRRIKNAMLGAILGTGAEADATIRAIAEDASLRMAAVLDGIKQEAHHILKLRNIEGREVYDIAPDIADALKEYVEFRRTGGKSLEPYLAQQDMFTGRPSLTEAIMREFFAAGQKPGNLAKTLNAYVKLAMLQDNEAPALFDMDITPREKLWELAVKNAHAEIEAEAAEAEAGAAERGAARSSVTAEEAGYSDISDYQGSTSFNGVAPSANGFFGTKEERAEAWEDGEFEDTMSLGDYIDNGIDISNLQFEVFDQRSLQSGDASKRATINNLRNARADLFAVTYEASSKAKKRKNEEPRLMPLTEAAEQMARNQAADPTLSASANIVPQNSIADVIPTPDAPRLSVGTWGTPRSYSKDSLVTAMAVQDVINGIERDSSAYHELARKLGIDKPEGRDYAKEAREIYAKEETKLKAIARKGLSPQEAAAETAKAIEQATLDRIMARLVSRSAKFGVDVGAAAHTAWQKLMNRLAAEARGLDLAQMQMDTGADLLATIMELDEETKREAKAEEEDSSSGGGGEAVDLNDPFAATGLDQNGEFVGPPSFQTWEEWQKNAADRLLVYNRVIALAKEIIAKRQEAKRAAEERREAAGNDEDGTGAEQSAASQDVADSPDARIEEGADEDEDPSNLPIPKEVLEANRIDLGNDDELAAFIRAWVTDWLVRKNPGSDIYSIFDSQENLAVYRKTVIAQLRNLASGLLDPTDGRAAIIAERMIGDIPSGASPSLLERRSADILSFIRRNGIRQKRKSLIKNLVAMIKTMAIKGKAFDALERDMKRKVRGDHEAYARYLAKVVQMTDGEIARETEALLAVIDGRKAQYAEAAAEYGIDVASESDVEIHRAMEKLAALQQYGGLKKKSPAYILAASKQIELWLDGKRAEHERRWGEFQTMCDETAALIKEAVSQGKKGFAPDEPGLGGKLFDDLVCTVRQRLEAMMVGADDAVRSEAISRVLRLLNEGSETLAVTQAKYRAEFEKALAHAVEGSGVTVAQLLRQLEEKIPEELNRKLIIDEARLRELQPDPEKRKNMTVQRTRMTWGQALQLYASLIQTASYSANIITYGREGHAELIREAASPEMIRLVHALQGIYQARRDELSDVVSQVTGNPIWNPDPLYMPVKMAAGREGLDVKAYGWSPLARSLTPRVRNSRDFDLTASLLGIYSSRTEETAGAIAFGVRGIALRSMLARKSTLDAMAQSSGKFAARKLIEQVTDTLTGGYTLDGARGGLMGLVQKAGSFTTYSALSWNLVAAVKQMTSIPMWSAVLDGGYLEIARHMASFDRGSARELIAAPGFTARYGAGSFARLVADAFSSAEGGSIVRRLAQAGMSAIQIGDFVPGIAVGTGWYKARVKQLAAKNPNADIAAIKKQAASETWSLIEECQQTSRAENQSAPFRRWGIVGKQLTKFASAPLQQVSHELHAFRMLSKARAEGDEGEAARWRKRLANIIIANHILLPLAMYATATLFGLALGDEPPEEDELFGDIALQMIVGPYASVFFAGAIVETLAGQIVSAFGGKPNIYEDHPFAAAQTIERLMRKGWMTGSDIAEADWESVRDDLLDMAGTVNAPTRYAVKAGRNITSYDAKKERAKRKREKEKGKEASRKDSTSRRSF